MTAREELLAGLTSDDVRIRASFVDRVTHVALDDSEVLTAFLALCRDQTPLPSDLAPKAPVDPFADFFGETVEAKETPLLVIATERLVFTGVIGKPDTVSLLVDAVEHPDSGSKTTDAIAKVLGETLWTDRTDAVRRLVPPLHRKGTALYAVLVRLNEEELSLCVDSALSPYTSRAVNELLNHQLSKPLMESALVSGILGGSLEMDEAACADALTLLVSWSHPQAADVALHLRPRFDWTLLVAGMENADSAEELGAWLARGEPAPTALVRKLAAVLEQSPDLPHFPLSAWLSYSGDGVGIARKWEAVSRARPALEAFVHSMNEAPARGWAAVEALCGAGEHADVVSDILAGLANDAYAEHWTASGFLAMATASPVIEGLTDAFSQILQRQPKLTKLVVPTLAKQHTPQMLRSLAEAYISMCEGRPVIRKPSRAGLIHEEREGVDPVPLQPIVHAIGDADLTRRLQDVLPYVRAEG